MLPKLRQKAAIFKGIPRTLPPLAFAYRLTQKASELGFDWPDRSGVLKKMDEELKEFREALGLKNRRRIKEELGDLLFVLVNVARFHQIDPEEALKGTLEKFNRRFLYIETALRQAGRSVHESSLEEMDRLWEKAKRKRIQEQPKVKAKKV